MRCLHMHRCEKADRFVAGLEVDELLRGEHEPLGLPGLFIGAELDDGALLDNGDGCGAGGLAPVAYRSISTVV